MLHGVTLLQRWNRCRLAALFKQLPVGQQLVPVQFGPGLDEALLALRQEAGGNDALKARKFGHVYFCFLVIALFLPKVRKLASGILTAGETRKCCYDFSRPGSEPIFAPSARFWKIGLQRAQTWGRDARSSVATREGVRKMEAKRF
jgi:hypothetical protein